MFKRLRKSDGFTLIELLVVVAILALLATIALPNVMSAFNESRKNSKLAEIATVQAAVDRFILDKHLAGETITITDLQANADSKAINWTSLVPKYLKTQPKDATKFQIQHNVPEGSNTWIVSKLD